MTALLFSHAGSLLKAHSWLRRWSNLNASDIKIFVAHLIVIGLVKNPNMAKYWSTNSLTMTPFFGKILSSNAFQNILVNLHISDNNTDYSHDNPNHDPLHKVRSFIQTCERTFQLVYRPGFDLSYDEACCHFKGRCAVLGLWYQQTVSFTPETVSDMWGKKWLYMCIWYVHWKGPDMMYTNCTHSGSKLYNNNKTFCGLMDSVHILDKGHCMYMDNFYTSPELYEELFYLFHICLWYSVPK